MWIWLTTLILKVLGNLARCSVVVLYNGLMQAPSINMLYSSILTTNLWHVKLTRLETSCKPLVLMQQKMQVISIMDKLDVVKYNYIGFRPFYLTNFVVARHSIIQYYYVYYNGRLCVPLAVLQEHCKCHYRNKWFDRDEGEGVWFAERNSLQSCDIQWSESITKYGIINV